MAGAAVLRRATCLQYTWSLVRSKGRNIPKVLAAPARVCTVVLSSGEELYSLQVRWRHITGGLLTSV